MLMHMLTIMITNMYTAMNVVIDIDADRMLIMIHSFNYST